MVGIYFAAFIISILAVILLVCVGKRQNITYFLLVFVTVAISNGGYFALATSSNVEEAVLATQITYFGGVFLPLFMFLCVLQLCKLHIPDWVVPILFIIDTVIMGGVFSIGYSEVYYKSMEFRTVNGVSYLVKEYGPLHKLYIVMQAGYVAAMFLVSAYSFWRQKNVSFKTINGLLFIEFISIGCYGVRRLMPGVMDWQCVIYIVDEIVILSMLQRMGMYDISRTVMSTQEQMEEYAYIIFDRKKNYIGSNELARKFLPELYFLKIDHPIDESEPFLQEHLVQWMENCDKEQQEEKNYLLRDGINLKCTVKFMYYGITNEKIGYLIEIVDDTKQQKYIEFLNNYNAELAETVDKKTAHISDMQNKMVLGMADIIESRDMNTGGHIKRTSGAIAIFAKELQRFGEEFKFSDRFLENLIKAAPMHDLGKIAVDDRILRKPGKFTPEEFEEMKTHSVKGAEIVERVLSGVEDTEFVQLAINVAKYHHEKWNGQGYPEKLGGLDIPPEARIMALADVFDALVSKRCYKEKMSYDEAFAIIEDSLGTHFDPVLGRLFINCREELEQFYNQALEEDSEEK